MLPSFNTTKTSLPVFTGTNLTGITNSLPFPGDPGVGLDLGALLRMEQGSGRLGHFWLMGCLTELYGTKKFSC